MTSPSKNPKRVAAGLKATLRNPNTSEETKARVNQRLQELKMQGEGENTPTQAVVGDEHKTADATEELASQFKLPNATHQEIPNMSSSKNPERVAAGLKGTLNNPNVSDEAKARASERLNDMGVSETSTTTAATERETPIRQMRASERDVDSAPALKGAVNNGEGPKIVEDAAVSLDDEDEYKPQGDVLAQDPEDEKYEYGYDDF
ncbi:hypothetical protein VNI00_012883 [Paramarasmius palmivorus]|uniref:Uncharacterized protein n=1 Tax=Paramarasmius palmivorus TaxID=297713 RepID=A0AAW0C1J0_9AGAR